MSKRRKFHRKPTMEILFTPRADQKQKALVQACEVEIGWFGTVKQIPVNGSEKDTLFVVTDIYVPEQSVTGVSIDSDGVDLSSFLMEHMEIADQLRFYGHSHVDFATNPSGVDLDQIVGWGEYGMDYLITHIINKRGETHTQFDQFNPRRITSIARAKVLTSVESLEWAEKQILDQLEITKSVKKGNMFVTEVVKEKGQEPRIPINSNF